MKRTAIVVILIGLVLASIPAAVAHCEIPCGIYGDSMRIDMLLEHVATVEKSMSQIVELSKDPAANANQLVRWIDNKETHCLEIQHVATQYFMTQRVKPKDPSDEAAYKAYVSQITALHGMLIDAMKAKQTTDAAHVESLRKRIRQFSESYFSGEDLKHLKEHHGW